MIQDHTYSNNNTPIALTENQLPDHQSIATPLDTESILPPALNTGFSNVMHMNKTNLPQFKTTPNASPLIKKSPYAKGFGIKRKSVRNPQA